MQAKKRHDALSIGDKAAEAKYANQLTKLNSLQSARDIDNYERSLQESEGLPFADNNTSDEEYDKYFSTARNEPFGQDLGPEKEENDKQRLAEQVLKQEQNKPGQAETSPQARAGATPKAPPESPKEEASPEEPKGGWARNALNRFRGTGKAKPPVGTGTAGATAAEGEATASATAKTGQIAARAGKAIASGFVRLWQAIVAGGPVVWIILGVGLILLIIFFVLGLSNMGLGGKDVSFSGGTNLRAVDSKDDVASLSNFLKLAGDTTIASETINKSVADIKANNNNAKELDGIKENSDLVNSIDVANAAFDRLAGSQTQANAQAALVAQSNVYNLLEGVIPIWQASDGPTRKPVASDITVFNNDLHGFSFLNNAQKDNHNVYIRSEDGKEQCDAVDIGVETGTSIFPIFGGKILDVSTDGEEGAESRKIIIQSASGKYTALYAHITSPVKNIGESISTTEPMGASFGNNIQIEVFYTGSTGNICLVTNHADLIDHAMSTRRHQSWGGYMWDRIVKTFSLK